jgi:hypothetical protein
MDFDRCNHKKLNQFSSEARRWNNGSQESTENNSKRGRNIQPAKRKKKGKK